jgi:hypothetical protein
MRSKNVKPYAPLCHSHLRYYFSNPERTTFTSDISERQFKAVKTILSQLEPKDLSLIKTLVYPIEGTLDLADTYITRRMEELATIKESGKGYYYKLLRQVDRKLAITLGYIPDMREGGGVNGMKLTKHDMNRRINNVRKYDHTLKEINDEYYVIPIKEKKGIVTIFCPHCMELHTHGTGYGHRQAHCEDPDVDNRAGYTIVQSFDSI